MKLAPLGVVLVVCGCSVLDGTYEALDDPNESSSSGAVDETNSTGSDPEPTTSTGTTGIPMDLGSEPETDTESASNLDIVAFTASTDKMLRAGSIVFEAEVEGEASELWLHVHQDGEPISETSWPLGSPTFEYIVNSDELDGELTFTLVASAGPANDSESVSVTVDLPESGSKDFRWVSPAIGRGMALGVLPGEGIERDQVVVVGNDIDDVLMMGVVTNGSLPMSPFPAMKVHALDVADGFIFVAGERDGEMVVRKYTSKLQQYWEVTVPDARALDVAVGPSGDVFVVGEVDVDGMFPHTEAALWTLTESGGFLHDVATFIEFDEWNIPLASSLTSVGFLGEQVVAAGFRQSSVEFRPPRATIFEWVDQSLLDRNVYAGTFEEERCSWNDMVVASGKLFTIGWHRTTALDPTSVAFGRYGEELVTQFFSPSWGGFGIGNTIAYGEYAMIAGHRTVALKPRLAVQAAPWSQSYVDDGGDQSWASDIAIDRHGYVHVVGEQIKDGNPHLLLVRLNP
ncbi:MAG: hypothetical protein ACPG4T_13680 [Nannocystaceae bacterium]